MALIHDHIKGEDFSDGDKKTSKKLGVPIYVLTPSGDRKVYEPKNDKTITLPKDKGAEPKPPEKDKK